MICNPCHEDKIFDWLKACRDQIMLLEGIMVLLLIDTCFLHKNVRQG